jgi:excisionase family DNA binding protein
MERALSVHETAEILNVCKRTVLREIERGWLQHFRAGRSVRVSREALLAYTRSAELQQAPRRPCNMRRPAAEATHNA